MGWKRKVAVNNTIGGVGVPFKTGHRSFPCTTVPDRPQVVHRFPLSGTATVWVSQRRSARAFNAASISASFLLDPLP